MIALLEAIGIFIVRFGKWIPTLLPAILPFLSKFKKLGYALLYFMGNGGASVIGAFSVAGLLGAFGVGVESYSQAMAWSRANMDPVLRCTLDYLHLFKYLRATVIAVLFVVTTRLSVIAFASSKTAFRGAINGVLTGIAKSK